jgi:hypothetical protein
VVAKGFDVVLVARGRQAKLLVADARDDVPGLGEHAREKVYVGHDRSLWTAQAKGLEETRRVALRVRAC